MTDAISRSDLLEQIVEQNFSTRTPWTSYATGYNQAVKTMRKEVQSAPALDVESVVRCQDCFYANPFFGGNYVRCAVWGKDIRKDGYCHCGERIDGEAK